MLGHMVVMTIGIDSLPCALVGFDDISSPEEEAVSNQGTDL
jgi:hypothetical protein